MPCFTGRHWGTGEDVAEGEIWVLADVGDEGHVVVALCGVAVWMGAGTDGLVER